MLEKQARQKVYFTLTKGGKKRMGFFFKKRIKLAKGINLNLSKSGLGVSFGFKGCRINMNSKGTYLNAGRNGLYLRKKLNGKNEHAEYIENVEEVKKEKVFIYQNKDVTKFSNIYLLTIVLTVIGVCLFIFGKILGVLLFIASLVANIQLKKQIPKNTKK